MQVALHKRIKMDKLTDIHSPAYTTNYGTPHTILTISQYPILKLTNKALTILYAHTNTIYTLKHSCDTHYLSQNLKNERIYTLELRDSNLYIKDKTRKQYF